VRTKLLFNGIVCAAGTNGRFQSSVLSISRSSTFVFSASRQIMFQLMSARSRTILEPRSRERDAANDTARNQAIIAAIESARNDIENEKAGLLDRYDRAKTRACALLAALDGEHDGDRLRLPLDEMEGAIIYCEGRVREIEAAKAHYDSLLKAARDTLL